MNYKLSDKDVGNKIFYDIKNYSFNRSITGKEQKNLIYLKDILKKLKIKKIKLALSF